MKVMRNRAIKSENRILAAEAAPEAIPVKPNIAATIAIIKKIADHLSMSSNF
jgi:hypothetical protein